MAGTSDKVKGSIKETVGKATGDKRMETEGRADKAKGDIKNAAEKVKDHVKDATK